MSIRDIFVIGASAGGVEALSQLVAGLPAEFPGSVFVVLHTLAGGESHLPHILSRRGSLHAVHPQDGMELQSGKIYVAIPNHHLMVDPGRVRSVIGPRESGHRPSVNVLFESAARAYGARVTGVILSGSLDDGTRGLHVIKEAGGIAIVQDPEEAAFAGMPRSALESVDVDHCSSASEIARTMVDIAQTGPESAPDSVMNRGGNQPANRTLQQQISGSVNDVGGFTCPECGGVLKEVGTDGLIHFRCHVGHTVSEWALLHAHGDLVEKALWTALRVLDERMSLADRAEVKARERGNIRVAERLTAQNRDARQKAETIRRVLLGGEGHTPATALQEQATGDEEPDGG